MKIPLPTFSRVSLFYTSFILFLLLFITTSGIIGSWVIGTRLLYGFYFFIYGNMGKMVIFSSIIFYLLTRERLKRGVSTLYHHTHSEKRTQTTITKATQSYDKRNMFYLLFACILTGIFFPVAHRLLSYPSFFSNLPLSVFTHALVCIIPVLLALGIFGPTFLRHFIYHFRKELLICLTLSIIFYFAIFYVWNLWPLLSFLVLHIEYSLLTLSFKNVHIIPPLTLFLDNFGVEIEESCSGLDSLFLFTALYVFIGILDWKTFNHKKLFLMFIVSATGTFFVNILRIYLLLLAGVFISPTLTVQLFHTYLGMVLFIIYFVLFWKSTYEWMKKNHSQQMKLQCTYTVI
jgi:exosortase/archaeosortase family protein